jgi:(2Fe-2S) ferredoxin
VSRFRNHIFVCVNDRPDRARGCCAARGSTEVLAALRLALAGNDELWESTAVTECGCLGPCTEGPTLVVYPEGIWYARVRKEDVAEIVREHLVGGHPVERLVHRWPEP